MHYKNILWKWFHLLWNELIFLSWRHICWWNWNTSFCIHALCAVVNHSYLHVVTSIEASRYWFCPTKILLLHTAMLLSNHNIHEKVFTHSLHNKMNVTSKKDARCKVKTCIKDCSFHEKDIIKQLTLQQQWTSLSYWCLWLLP